MTWLAFGTTTYELREGDVIVGSGFDAQWRLTSVDLAPAHFVVSVRGSDATLKPSSRDAVVALNGEQVHEPSPPLVDGDVILAGSGRFLFSRAVPGAFASRDSTPELGYLVDDQAGVAHALGPSTLIGRAASNAIIVHDPTASRFHADIRREAGGFVLRSIGASGTKLNRQPMKSPTLLAEGDRIEIAFSVLRFTTLMPPGDIVAAAPHSIANDAAGRRPTLAGDSVLAVEKANRAGRAARLIQITAGLVVIAAGCATWWWVSSQ
jgi:predicted component of type VI protein secretion system